MAKIFNIPFATTGDREEIPQTAQPDNLVSFAEGYTADYALDPEISPDAKDIERAKFNSLMHAVTEAIFEIQRYGAALWQSAAAPYPIKARVYYDGAIWSSAVGNNNATPGSGSNWALEEILFSSQAQALAGTNNSTSMTPLRDREAMAQFGVGATSQTAFTGDVRTINQGGTRRVASSATNLPLAAAGTLTVEVLDANNRTLVFRELSDSPRVYSIQLRGGVWDSAWRTVWTSQNQLGLGATLAAARTTLQIDNVDNTSDANKPISVAAAAALAEKADSIITWGPGVSANTTVGNAWGGRITPVAATGGSSPIVQFPAHAENPLPNGFTVLIFINKTSQAGHVQFRGAQGVILQVAGVGNRTGTGQSAYSTTPCGAVAAVKRQNDVWWLYGNVQEAP